MQYLYAVEMSGFEDTKEHHKNLIKSIDSIHELFLFQISLFVEILKKAKSKYNISLESVTGNISSKYTNTRFYNNRFLSQIISNSRITRLFSSNAYINWEIDYKFANLIYDKIIDSDIYSNYINEKSDSYQMDSKFIYDSYKEIIVPDEKFQSFIEEKNIFWMDDFAFVNTLILKLIKSPTPKSFEKSFYFNLFSNSSDRKYSDDLANLSIRNFKENNILLTKYVANWDIDRLAKIDLVILNLALTELKAFKDIPIKVSLNEYIEISKDYSTEKSSFFINGILDKVVKDLVSTNSIIKEGRGLRE